MSTPHYLNREQQYECPQCGQTLWQQKGTHKDFQVICGNCSLGSEIRFSLLKYPGLMLERIVREMQIRFYSTKAEEGEDSRPGRRN